MIDKAEPGDDCKVQQAEESPVPVVLERPRSVVGAAPSLRFSVDLDHLKALFQTLKPVADIADLHY